MDTTEEGRSFLSSLTLKNWLAIGLAVLALAFIVQNRDVVSIDVFFVNIRLPLWISLSLIFVAGWLSGRFSRSGKAS